MKLNKSYLSFELKVNSITISSWHSDLHVFQRVFSSYHVMLYTRSNDVTACIGSTLPILQSICKILSFLKENDKNVFNCFSNPYLWLNLFKMRKVHCGATNTVMVCVLLIEYVLNGKHVKTIYKLNDFILYLPCWSSVLSCWSSLVFLVHYKIHYEQCTTLKKGFYATANKRRQTRVSK